MKKIAVSLLTVCLLLTFSPFESKGATALNPMSLNSGIPAPPEPAAKAMLDRLAEIQSLDKSGMSGREKRALRKETRSIKKGLGEYSSGGGVYLSVGVLLLIIILLIVLL
ncbi:MAG TPA: hypothetical protein PK228_08380 [Saprospiraceae bacterium]|nr:hypothetical protein [Saprospiraceae bacterium]